MFAVAAWTGEWLAQRCDVRVAAIQVLPFTSIRALQENSISVEELLLSGALRWN
jgi:hypothetical protein